MKKSITILCALAMSTLLSYGQNVTVQSAVGMNLNNFLMQNLVGQGVYIYNAKFNNMAGAIQAIYPQIGTFQSNGFAGLSMTSGIVLTTGNVSVAGGPNSSPAASASVSPRYIDPQMNTMDVTDNAFSCATLDFDFVCLSPYVTFTYCFGSEEYPEWVASQYNDVFVFFLTGPDPETGETVTRNIAMIPNSADSTHPYGIPVSINTINPGQPGANAYGTPPGEVYYTYTQYYCDNNTVGNTGIEYDGYTAKLMASAMVYPCQSYHMHISVCDVSDNQFQSGVFLEGNSFSTNTAGIGLASVNVDTVFRGTPKQIPVSLAGTDFDTATVHVSFGGDAIYGIDLLCSKEDGTVLNIGDIFTIGQNSAMLSIQVLPNVTEPISFDIYFQTAFCPEYPNLLVADTVHMILAPERANSGIVDVEESDALRISPNPATDQLTVSAAEALRKVVIIDAAGREVYSQVVAAGSNVATLNISHLAAGIYTLQAFTSTGELAGRVVVK